MIKTYKTEIVPDGGRKYEITDNGDGSYSITDITQYIQEGSPFTALDVQGVGIIEVTHTKSGKNHVLTTENSTAENIKFQATQNYNADDTFSINNVSFTVLFQNSNYSGAGTFAAGQWVFANVDYTNNIITIMQNTGIITVPPLETKEAIMDWLLTFNPGVYHLAIYINNTATTIGLPVGHYWLKFFRTTASQVNNVIVAYMNTNTAIYDLEFSDASPYDGGWNLIGGYTRNLSASDATDFYTFLQGLTDNTEYTFISNNSVSVILGLQEVQHIIKIYRYTNLRIYVSAQPFNGISVEYRGNVFGNTWSGFTAYELTPAT